MTGPASAREQASQLDALLAELHRAYSQATELIRSAGNPHDAFDAATRLTTALRDMADAAARLRGDAITAIWQAEELSLAALAKRVGVSKSRANQLIQAAARTSTREDDRDG